MLRIRYKIRSQCTRKNGENRFTAWIKSGSLHFTINIGTDELLQVKKKKTKTKLLVWIP